MNTRDHAPDNSVPSGSKPLERGAEGASNSASAKLSVENQAASTTPKNEQREQKKLETDGTHWFIPNVYGEAIKESTPKPATEAQKKEQSENEARLKSAERSTGNLVMSSAFELQGNAAEKKQLGGSLQFKNDEGDGKSSNGLQIKFNDPIPSDKDIVLTQGIDYKFNPVTDVQRKIADQFPNVDLGHYVDVHFRAKADREFKFTAELMGSNKPYKLDGFQRIDLDSEHGKKDKDGFTTYDFREAVPSTMNPKDIQFKLDFGRSQQAGELDIKDLRVSEVAPDAALNTVIKEYTGAPAVRPDAGQFMFGAIGNKLVDANIRPTDAGFNQMVFDIQKKYPCDEHEQLKAVKDALTDYTTANAPTEQQKIEILKQLKEYGVNTLTIPVYWDQIEPNKGQPDYSKVDHLVELAQQFGMKAKLHPVVWAGNYPGWVDSSYDAKTSKLSHEQYTEATIKDHINQVIDHFGNKFGKEIGFVEINEMNSTDQLMNAQKDDYGRPVQDADGNVKTLPVSNGLIDLIKRDKAESVVKEVDGVIRTALDRNPELKNTKLLENEYLGDQLTKTFSEDVSKERDRPDAFGKESHQFSPAYLNKNENEPLLSIDLQERNREVNGVPSYASEITVPTTVGGAFDESHMSPEVARATKEWKDSGAKPLSDLERQAQERQAEELLAWYKISTANRQNIGMSLWDGSDKNGWMGNTGGVLDAEYKPKISYFAIKDFIEEFKARNEIH